MKTGNADAMALFSNLFCELTQLKTNEKTRIMNSRKALENEKNSAMYVFFRIIEGGLFQWQV